MTTTLQVERIRKNMKMTVLYRRGGKWSKGEVERINLRLKAETSQDPNFPEYVILLGHFTKEETRKAIIGGVLYFVIKVTGMDSDKLPFIPDFL